MELIESFAVDHTKIVPGIYVSRVDYVDSHAITTYDIRLTCPNIEPSIDVAAMHTLEHIIATYLRNNDEWKNAIIYWGPMGCLTGFYLILKGSHVAGNIYPLILDAFKHVLTVEDVPGATAVSCGSYRMHNLEIAKWYARRFSAYLDAHKNDPSIFNYPKSGRAVTADGQQFYDS